MKLKQTLLIITLGLASTAAFAQAVKVEQPWARPTVQGQQGGGGFLRIVGGAAPDKLLGASSEIAGRVEVHTMEMKGNVMHMREIGSLDVPAGKTVELKPGGLHLMFMDLKTPLANGSSFPLTLRFEKAGEVKVNVQVQSRAPAGSSAGQDHGHHGKDHGKHGHKH